MTKKNLGVPVSLRALIQRINRKLATKGECLKTARGERARVEVGDFSVIDVTRNVLLFKDVSPEMLGRDLGVLEEWEAVR